MRNETDSIPDIFVDVLTPSSGIRNYNTRFVRKLNYFRLRGSTNLGKMSFKLSSLKIWETVLLASSVCHIISLRKNESSLSSNQSNLILALLVCSITDTI